MLWLRERGLPVPSAAAAYSGVRSGRMAEFDGLVSGFRSRVQGRFRLCDSVDDVSERWDFYEDHAGHLVVIFLQRAEHALGWRNAERPGSSQVEVERLSIEIGTSVSGAALRALKVGHRTHAMF